MGFYDELSKYYDIIFPLSKMKVDFLNNEVENNSEILDIACGTGTYSVELSRLGHKVTGVDLDKEMIKLAGEKAKNEDVKVDFEVADMRKISEIFDKKYDMIYCIGNSLVHLQSLREIESLMKEIFGMLNEKGKLIIQIINYDRIFKFNVDSLPLIAREDKGVTFIRKYDYNKEEEKLYFNTEIVIDKEGEEKRYSNSIPLLPVRSFELVDGLKSSGFSEIKLYGDFTGREFNEESYPLIAVAQK